MAVTLDEQFLEDGIRILSLRGSLDAPSAMAIEDEFRDTLLEPGGHVIVDLAGVDYLSSYALRMFLSGAKALLGIGASLVLAAPDDKVRQVLSLAGYDTVFPVIDTVEGAVEHIRG